MKKQEIQSAALNIIQSEYDAWKDGRVWVTDEVFSDTRDVVEQSRKNYLGVFENPINPITGQEKEWVPQTEISVDNAVKSSDIDMKDINITSANPHSSKFTSVVRAELRRCLYHINFGERLNLHTRTLGIDGTAIWKTIEEKEDDGYYYPRIIGVDILNTAIDPTSECIAEAVKNGGFIERTVISRREFEEYDDFINKDEAVFETVNRKNDASLTNNDAGTTEYVTLFERWGIFPEYLITGLKKDTKYVYGRIVASGGKNGLVCHLIEKRKKYKNPYEEDWFIRLQYIWRGRSIAEKLFDLQRALNRTHNVRATRGQISQAGLWTVKKGKGIKQENMTNLTTNGAIFVQEHDDIAQLDVADVPVSSYKDEEILSQWSRQNTSAFESSTGETMASSMPATNAVIQSRAVQSTFDLVKENIGMFIERWIKNQVFPIIEKNLTQGKIIRLTGDVVDLDEFDKELATKLAYNKAANSFEAISREDINKMIKGNIEKFKTYGDARYIELDHDIKISDFDVKVTVTDENSNIAIMTQRLVQMMSVAPEYRDKFVKEALDLMGIDTGTLQPKATPEQQAEMVKAGGGEMPDASAQEYTDANTAAYNAQQ